MLSSRLSAGESECVVLCRSVYVCVSYEKCRVAVGLLERLSAWCCAGPSVCVCVLYEERRVAVDLLQRVSVVLGRSVCVCVCHTRNAE